MIFLAIPALPPLPPAAQQQILETIKQQQPFARSYGECAYDWNQWKLSAEGIRNTKRLCKHEIEDIVAVSCSTLKTNTFEDGQWGKWRSPLAKEAKPGEELMVAALCANITPEAKP
jgi:hypothetical protein